MAKGAMKPDEVDICERGLAEEFGEVVFGKLLLDHTTGRNIYWATDSYAGRGEGFGFRDEIEIGKICGEERVIRPRAVKSREEQAKRVKDKAEVFTPSWVCNLQNNLVDEAWFGKKGVFNSPDKKDPHGWKVNADPVKFPDGKTWMDYVTDVRMEISCGEAPYLVSRYDTVTGEPIALERRIGIIDRKLRVVGENTTTSQQWLNWAKLAYATTYGFEYQGDNLLLAREAMFISFKEYYIAKFGEKAYNKVKRTAAPGFAYLISWNLWQMDAFTMGLPGYEEELKKREAAEAAYKKQCDEITEDYRRKREEEEKRFKKSMEKYEAEIKSDKENHSLFEHGGLEIAPTTPKPVKNLLPEPEMPEPLGEREWFERYCVLKNFKAVNNIAAKSTGVRPEFGRKVPRCEFRELAAEKK